MINMVSKIVKCVHDRLLHSLDGLAENAATDLRGLCKGCKHNHVAAHCDCRVARNLKYIRATPPAERTTYFNAIMLTLSQLHCLLYAIDGADRYFLIQNDTDYTKWPEQCAPFIFRFRYSVLLTIPGHAEQERLALYEYHN